MITVPTLDRHSDARIFTLSSIEAPRCPAANQRRRHGADDEFPGHVAGGLLIMGQARCINRPKLSKRRIVTRLPRPKVAFWRPRMSHATGSSR